MADAVTNWTLRAIPDALTVCKVDALTEIDWDAVPLFVGRTEEEISVVCPTARAPRRTTAREDGWRGFSIVGTLDFSLRQIILDFHKDSLDNLQFLDKVNREL